MKKLLQFLTAGILIVSAQSCATILSGTSDQITFRSYPPGAKVLIDGKEVGTTNNSISVKRKFSDTRIVTFQKDDHKDLTFEIEQKIVPVFFLGIVTAIGPLIDIMTGAALQPKDNTFEKTLEKK